jgi:hypothetical protein
VNKVHRISLSSQWKLAPTPTIESIGKPIPPCLSAQRTFHKPSGLSPNQEVSLRLAPADNATLVFLAGEPLVSVILDGILTTSIAPFLQTSNQIEIRWSNIESSVSQLPESFSVWLEISEIELV